MRKISQAEGVLKYLCRHKINELVFRIRFFWYFRFKKNFRFVNKIGNHTLNVKKSLNEMKKGVSNHRPKQIVMPLISLSKEDKEKFKVLSVGSRYETEILYLKGVGFKNVRGLDLFSYSPWIDIGDMHDMPYEDNHFDVMTLGWIVSYSDNIELLKKEIIRCSKNGSIISIGVSAYTKKISNEDQKNAVKNNLVTSIDNLDVNTKNIHSNITPDIEDYESRIQTVEKFRELFKGNIKSELFCKNPFFEAPGYKSERDDCIYIFVLKK